MCVADIFDRRVTTPMMYSIKKIIMPRYSLLISLCSASLLQISGSSNATIDTVLRVIGLTLTLNVARSLYRSNPENNQESLMAFFTADICDEHSDKVFVLAAGYKNYGGADKCQGKIVTVKLDRNNTDLIGLLKDEDGAGKVVVVDVDREYFAVVGENLMKFAHKNNFAGIIVNGYVRDTLQIKDIPVALYAMGTCPRKYIPVTSGERNGKLSFGGIVFNHGDYLYADTDGVIVTAEKIV